MIVEIFSFCQLYYRQHEEDYLMTDEELLCSILEQCPSICPPRKMPYEETAIIEYDMPQKFKQSLMLA
ncbi:unnamed protein product [Gongylonema pulchrum]|uniref:PAZ domain-containing protein n=1 Tax=Gongylonema pulchrum TaxID=637853 RepID=A0A183E7U8_9BILA|nr:unnamed protein product [Gongylonema pulchrum]